MRGRIHVDANAGATRGARPSRRKDRCRFHFTQKMFRASFSRLLADELSKNSNLGGNNMTRSKMIAAISVSLGISLALGALNAPARADDTKTQYTFAMITHAQAGDTFWDVVRKGAEAAAKNVGAKLIYLNDQDASKQAQLVDNVLQQHVDGIAMTLAFPDAMADAVSRAHESKVFTLAFNSGFEDWERLGLNEYVGQNESLGGEGAGKRLNEAGAKSVLCTNHQIGAVQLEARCAGLKKTFKGAFFELDVPGYDMAGVQARITAKLQQSPDIDYIVTLSAPFVPAAMQAMEAAGSKAKIGTFDLTPEVIDQIKTGAVQFAIDQQPFVEGYEAIDLLWLNKDNGNTLGGGLPVLTGPTFITKDNVDVLAKFAAGGTR